MPLLLGLTYLPRRVWLDDPGDPQAPCISCGRIERLVRGCVFAGRGSTKTKGGDAGRSWHDPHVLYFRDKEGSLLPEQAGNALKASDAAADRWARMLERLLERKGDERRLWVVGFSTVQNDKYLEATEWTVSLPSSLEQTDRLREQMGQWQRQGRALARKVRPRDEAKSGREHPEIQAMLAAARPDAERKASARAADLLAGTGEAWAEGAGRLPSDDGGSCQGPLSWLYDGSAPTAKAGRRHPARCGDQGQPTREEPAQERRHQVSPTPTEQFINVLTKLKPGDLGMLRMHAGQGLDESVNGFDLFTGLWWPLRQANRSAPRRDVAWLVAKLYASCPVPHVPEATLALRLARCRPRDGDARERFCRTFDDVLLLPLDQIEQALRWAVGIVEQNDRGLDWVD